MDLAEGALFAGYRVERRLGPGVVGETYLARHPRLPRSDVLEVLSRERGADAESRSRFLRRAEVAALVRHPNLLGVRDRGEHDGRLWIATPYVEGEDLVATRRRRGADVDFALRVVSALAEALDEIHRAGLRHGGVRPESVVVDAAGEPERVLLGAFGVERPLTDSDSRTDRFAAPELRAGEPADDRADVYALGAVLHYLLVGAPPTPSGSDVRDAAGIPQALMPVLAKALAHDPADRYPSCGALATAARTALLPEPGSMSPLASTRARRARRPVLVGASAVALSLILVIGSLIYRASSDDDVSAAPPTTALDRAAAASLAAWSPHDMLFTAFRGFLPDTPLGIGYQDMHECYFHDEREQPVAFDARNAVDRLDCTGDQEPMAILEIVCNGNGAPLTDRVQVERQEGEERWTRASGTGVLKWGSFLNQNGVIIGELVVSFEGPDRDHCRLRAVGGASGSELREKWWVDAPL